MACYRHLVHGFEPIFDARSRVLVLGSFPSELSRRNDFYYGNPQNRFWRVLAACADVPEPQTVDEKRALLLSRGVALWDVIQECDVKGSSDASIKNVEPVAAERIVGAARIERVLCNGAVAGRLYRRYLQWKVGLEAEILPSTSPANAAWGFERLCERWAAALGPLPALPTLPALPALPETAETPRPLEFPELPGPAATEPRTDYAVISTAPAASSYAVHRSMQGNRGRDTKPELLVRKRLREAGLGGYRLQWKAPGRPDVAWPGKRVCLFVNGCYWHRCPHCHPSMPKKHVEYWQVKFARNVERDERNLAALAAEGWRVHVIWECQLKKGVVDETFAALLPQLSRELGKPLKSE